MRFYAGIGIVEIRQWRFAQLRITMKRTSRRPSLGKNVPCVKRMDHAPGAYLVRGSSTGILEYPVLQHIWLLSTRNRCIFHFIVSL